LIGYQVDRGYGGSLEGQGSSSGYPSYLRFGADGTYSLFEQCFSSTEKATIDAGTITPLSGGGGPTSCAASLTPSEKSVQLGLWDLVTIAMCCPTMHWSVSQGQLTISGGTATLTYAEAPTGGSTDTAVPGGASGSASP
jgi:hypothetical protein